MIKLSLVHNFIDRFFKIGHALAASKFAFLSSNGSGSYYNSGLGYSMNLGVVLSSRGCDIYI